VKMFDSVAMACVGHDLDVAMAIRASLELFGLRVHFHLCVQKRNVVDFLRGDIPDSEYVILCSGGHHTGEKGWIAPGEDQVGLTFGDLVEQVDGEWESVKFFLRPDNIRDYVKLPGRTVICNGCNTGHESLARAFLETGCKAYVGPTRSVDQDSTAIFTIAFFYHLLSSERDPSLQCSDEEAVQRAASLDRHLRVGTASFRYYSRDTES
jgi:hypothetical protein